MSLVVLKFGGTSLANITCITRAAETIAQEYRAGHQVIVVVSAMAGTTNQLIAWAQEAGGFPGHPEYDVVASTGEQITAGLLALVLEKQGFKSRSWTGSQIPIYTTDTHSEATIINLSTSSLLNFAAEGGISIVAGFQGVTLEGRTTTLGRGGSDTTAVALACFLKAARCDIYTDVEGVYTADPRMVEEAQKIEALTYDEMLALSEHGAKVLHPHAVHEAQKHHLPLRVLSSFTFKPGTLISFENGREKPLFGLTYTLGWVLVESSKPFPETTRYHASEIFYGATETPVYRAILSQETLSKARTTGEDLTAGYTLNENLASISFMTGAFDKHHMRHLRARFLSALSDPSVPPIRLRATHSFQWQLWVAETDLPTTLRFLHRRLQQVS